MKRLLSKVKSYFKGDCLSKTTSKSENSDVKTKAEDWRREDSSGIYLEYPNLKVPVVNDFVEPRYVYANLKESVEHNPEFGDVIGYRIANDLVIHDMCSNGYMLRDSLNSFEAKFGAELLDYYKDVPTLLKYFDKINEMREAIGDVCIKVNQFWVHWEGYTESCECATGELENDPDISCLIAKRKNA